MKTLTPLQISRLEELEAVVEKGKQSFVDVGLALCAIRDEKLWSRDHNSFEAYCQARWGWSQQRGSQLIKAANVIKKLPPKFSTMVENERVARELEKVPEPERAKVLEEAKETGPVTAKAVKEAAKPTPTPPPKAPPAAKQKPSFPLAMLDETKYPIPQKLEPLWNRGLEVRALMSKISKVKCALQKAHADGDPLYHFLYAGNKKAGLQTIVANLEQAYASLSACIPYAVCFTCQGQAVEHCTACGKTGLIGQFYFDTCVPAEVKEIRKKSSKQ